MALVWLAAVVTAFVAVLALAAVVSHWVGRHGAGPLLWRFLTGHHMDGRYRTDAGFFRPGTRVIHVTGHASRWAHWPRYRRAGVRLAAVAVAVAVSAVAVTDWRALAAVMAVLLAVLLAVAALLAAVRVRDRRHYLTYVRPLHKALHPVAGHPAALRPRSWLSIPRDFASSPGAVITIRLPEGYQPGAGAKRRLLEVTTGRLGIDPGGADVTWSLAGPAPRAIITLSAPPPERVGLAAIRAVIESAPEHAPVLGLGRGGRIVSADLIGDSPHILVSAGTGGGKSTVTRALAAQMLHRGALLLIADYKRQSHPWTRGLPNIAYARSAPEISALLLAAAAELTRRNALTDELIDIDGNLPPEDQAAVGPRIVVVVEELNGTAVELAKWWRSVREPDDPGISPAVEALGSLLFMGRSARMNVIGIAQYGTARAIGGPEMRENFGIRIMARATRRGWSMLAPEVQPVPPPTRHPGRMHVVVAGTATETQILNLSGDDARGLATSGTVAKFGTGPDWLAGARVLGQIGGSPGETPGGVLGHDGPPPITLREAVRLGMVGCSLDVIRKASTRDAAFPEPVARRGKAMAYDPAALTRWEAGRPGAR